MPVAKPEIAHIDNVDRILALAEIDILRRWELP
jgi:hypothetical protein